MYERNGTSKKVIHKFSMKIDPRTFLFMEIEIL